MLGLGLVLPAVPEAEVVAPAVAAAVAVAGSDESIASAVYDADRPVTFEHTLGGCAEPDTKLTAAHCSLRMY